MFNPNKKRKVALFMAYVGHGYQVRSNPCCHHHIATTASFAAAAAAQGAPSCARLTRALRNALRFPVRCCCVQGMQRNPGARTIEDELFGALHKAGAISDANADEHGFMKVGRLSLSRLLLSRTGQDRDG